MSALEDGFYDYKRISRVCNPVSVNGSSVRNEAGKVLCDLGTRSRGRPRYDAQDGLHASTQLGETVLSTRRIEEICVPAR